LLAHRQTDRQTDKQTNKVWQKHNLLGGGKGRQSNTREGTDRNV